MCGISGYSGIPADARTALIYSLGDGIDRRGGHAAGFLTLGPGRLLGTDMLSHRRIGTWDGASNRFLRRASSGHTTMMHARFATCGARDEVSNAHPFAIRRNGKTVLHGMHNGVLEGTHTSARVHGRAHTVDSRELFELLADDKIDRVRELEGYGVITFVRPEDNHVSLVRLSEDSDIELVSLEEGGIVWGSTMSIVEEAVDFAGLKIKGVYKLDEIGRVYKLRTDGAFLGANLGITVKRRTYSAYTYYTANTQWNEDWEESPDSWEQRLMKEWAEEQNAV